MHGEKRTFNEDKHRIVRSLPSQSVKVFGALELFIHYLSFFFFFLLLAITGIEPPFVFTAADDQCSDSLEERKV